MTLRKGRSNISGINNLNARMNHRGGFPQQDRMIKDKRWTLDHAVKYSYQAAKVRDIGEEKIALALMNPDKLKQNYDDKIISIGYEWGFKPGTVFEWCNTGTKWIVYLQHLEELAYFRADVRRCRYQANFVDENGELHTIYLAVRGPVETQINYIQKGGISVDTPNHSINFLMSKNEDTLKYFKRYSKFYIRGLEGEHNPEICWRVEAVDAISMPGIIEINAEEYYANEFEDDKENGVAGGLIIKPVDIPEETEIKGEGFIKPKVSYKYTINMDNPSWYIDTVKYPIEYKVDENKVLTIKWTKTYSGQFEIKCGNYTKTVVVESLF